VDVCAVVDGAANAVDGAAAADVVIGGAVVVTGGGAAVVVSAGFEVVEAVLVVELQPTSTMTRVKRIANITKIDFFTYSSFLLLRASQ
jgi:hypothetical protein